ncbi:uncharacterized protein LOC112128134 [Cimex lectularius]|uniref:Uncharacterized protein n=1 Tax=Cimex lectularius TaxID=79782 RepID=A0A8I6STY9_CIMLE|nr:uncharacterized protein LOC112128134 [Cimex lectularius]
MSQKINYKIAKEDYDHIPFFDGNPSQLALFCEILETAYSVLCAENIVERDYNHNILFIKTKSKLVGPARNVLLSHEINHLLILIKILKENFAHARSFEILKEEVMRTRLNPKESPIEFVNRVQGLRNLVYIRLKLDGLSSEALKELMIRIDKEIIFHIYKCLPPALSNYIMIFNLESLDDVRSTMYNKCSLLLSNVQVFSNGPKHFQHNNNQSKYINTTFDNRHKFHSNNYHGQHFKKPDNCNDPNHPFNRPRPFIKRDSQNTVSMRSVGKPRISELRSPYELTHCVKAKTNHTSRDRINRLEHIIHTLTEKFDHFLELGKESKGSPPSIK